MGKRMLTGTRVSYTKHRMLLLSYSHNLVVEMNREEDDHETFGNEPRV